jgi:hypothetical protein
MMLVSVESIKTVLYWALVGRVVSWVGREIIQEIIDDLVDKLTGRGMRL